MQPTMDEQRAFWNAWIAANPRDAYQRDAASLRRRDEVLAYLRSLALPRPDILEVGCSNGWLCAELAQFGPVTGTDLAPAAIEEASNRYPHIQFVAGDFYELDFSQKDVVVCVDSLASVADHPRFIARMDTALKPGGYLIITTQNPFVFSRYSGLAPLSPGQVRNWTSRDQLRRLLSADFDVLDLKTVAPRGDLGILRIVNNRLLNRVAGLVLGRARRDRLKEACGLGQTIVCLARKR